MTTKELAEMLSGRDVGEEVVWGEEQNFKDAGLVVVYSRSDDDVEFVGAIDDEVGAYEGTTIYLTKTGILDEPVCGIAENIECPYFIKAREKAKTIKAVWHDEGSPYWTFETDIPHETFTIMEDGEPWCIGIVFSMADLGGDGGMNLKPCPFCGSAPAIHSYRNQKRLWFRIRCSNDTENCRIMPETMANLKLVDAAADWNQRDWNQVPDGGGKDA